MKKRFLFSLLGIFLSLSLILPYIPAKAADEFDFGDAPDGNRTYYTGTSTGSFPSKLASNGARTSNIEEVWLGQKVNKDIDSKQIDADLYDDGVDLSLVAEKKSSAKVLVHVKKAGETSGTAYINMFFDWNKDGKWEGNDGAADEWAVRNFPVDLSEQTKDVAAYVPQFTAGKKINNIWYRAIVTLDERVTAENGTGSFQKGEVEDYGPAVGTSKKFGAVCKPKLKVIKHGAAGNFKIQAKPGSVAITQTLLANSVTPNTKSRKISKVGARTFRYQSKQKDPPKRVVFETVPVRVRFGKTASIVVNCQVAVVHDSLQAKAQNVHDYTLTGFEGSVRTIAGIHNTVVYGTMQIKNEDVIAKGITGFDIPFSAQYPSMPQPYDIDIDIDGSGWPSDWQCQVISTTIIGVGDSGSKRCWGQTPIRNFLQVLLYFDSVLSAFTGIHFHLLDLAGNIIGAVDLPKEE